VEYKLIKIIIDTNIWISFFIGKHLIGLQNYINEGKFKIITCKEQIEELTLVLNRQKMRKYFSEDKIHGLIELILEISEILPLSQKVDLCRDKKDNYLLSLAISSNADYLITGDLDLLVLDSFLETRIITYSDFRQIIA